MKKVLMIRQFVKDTKNYLLQKPRLIKLAFFVWFCRSIEVMLLLGYNLNNVLIYRFGKWMSIFTMFQYFIDTITKNHIIWLIVLIAIIISLWYLLLYPMGISATIHFLNQKTDSIWKAMWKGANDFFIMFELNALAFSFWPYTYMITVLRLITLDVLNSWFVIWLFILWGVMVLFASVFIIVEEKIWVFEAIKKSMSITILNIWITFRWLIMKMIVLGMFYFKTIIIIWVPVLLMYFLITTNIINSNNERIMWTIWIIATILWAYILSVIQAFFITFWHKIYHHILEKKDSDD